MVNVQCFSSAKVQPTGWRYFSTKGSMVSMLFCTTKEHNLYGIVGRNIEPLPGLRNGHGLDSERQKKSNTQTG